MKKSNCNRPVLKTNKESLIKGDLFQSLIGLLVKQHVPTTFLKEGDLAGAETPLKWVKIKVAQTLSTTSRRLREEFVLPR